MLDDEKLKKMTVLAAIVATGIGEVIWVAWVFAAGGASIADLPLVLAFAISIAVAIFVVIWAMGGFLRWVLKKLRNGGASD